MSDAFWQSLFANLPQIIGAIAGAVVAIYLAHLNRGVKEVKQQQHELVKNTNGLVEDKVRRAREEGRAEALRELKNDRRASMPAKLE